MVEPAACGIHAALASGTDLSGATVAVIGAGTLGLTVIAALRRFLPPGLLLAGAKHPEQRRLAASLGADQVLDPEALVRGVRRHTRSLANGAVLTGGADVVIDCVGNAESIDSALSMVRPKGRVVLAEPGPMYAEGDPAACLYVLLSGTLVMSRRTQSAKAASVATASKLPKGTVPLPAAAEADFTGKAICGSCSWGIGEECNTMLYDKEKHHVAAVLPNDKLAELQKLTGT